MRPTRMSHRLAATALGLLAVVAGTVVSAAPATAAEAKDFDPGFLISDEQFFDGTALTAAQVDTFIAGMNQGCATGKVCLRNYKETIKAKKATTRCKAVAAGTNRTAGQIIAAVGAACGISPKAILVILQKEQSLVTATGPRAHAFQAAMGAGCPDTAPCDGNYAGFYEQVYYGASLLKGYTIPGSTHYNKYPVGKTSAIGYHPNSFAKPATCGKKDVLVKNMATHALYVYTPYTPNAAALKNLYGTGDKCSAYGNRNFWRMYTDWWGATGSSGALAVAALHTSMGGNDGTLGKPVGTMVRIAERGAGMYQEYANGVIAWNAKNGARVIGPDLAAAWIARLGEFGWPREDTLEATAAGGGVHQNFDSAVLAKPAGGKVFTVWAAIRDQYVASGGPQGPMGWPTAFQVKDANARYTQVFANGTAIRVGTTSGFVDASLVKAFTSRGGETGQLGWPTGFATASKLRGGGTWQAFAKGTLFASSKGTHAVYGTTRSTFTKLGGVEKVGWPLRGRVSLEGTAWQRQDFEKGTILNKGTTSAYVATALVPAWKESGLTTGHVGKPTHNPVVTTANGGGAYQGFAKATLAQQNGKKAFRLVGTARTAWAQTGRESGTLGWPTSQPTTDKKLKVTIQKFQKGVLIYSGKKYAVVGAKEWALAKKQGVGAGALGWPTTGIKTSTAGAGGEYQRFTTGTIAWQKDRGATYVPKKVWSALSSNGGLKGPLGWPTAAVKKDAKTGTISQKFEGGTVTVTKAGKVTVKLAGA